MHVLSGKNAKISIVPAMSGCWKETRFRMNTTRRRMGLLLAASAATVQAHDDEFPPVIARTAMIHGIAGPFAIAGYRMGEHALTALGLQRGSIDLEVAHFSPAQVQWTCIVDGLQAATGASLGKMNLRCTESAETYSIVKNRKTGRELRFEVNPKFLKAFANTPPNNLYQAGMKAADLKEAELYVVR